MAKPSALPDLSTCDMGENNPETCRDGSALPVCPAPREHGTLSHLALLATLTAHPSIKTATRRPSLDCWRWAPPGQTKLPDAVAARCGRALSAARGGTPTAAAAALGRPDRCTG
eukprot:1095889-Prymnesium_polylepis.1